MSNEIISSRPASEIERILRGTTYGMPKTSVLSDDKKPDPKPEPEPLDFSMVPRIIVDENNQLVFVIPSKMNFT